MSIEIEQSLDLAPTTTSNALVVVEERPVEDENQRQIEQDFDFARDNLRSIISKGVESLDEIISVAQQSQHPRAYEVLNGMLKTLADINKDLLSIQKDKKELSKPAKQGPSTVNNNLFVGTPADLNKIIEARKETED